MIDGGGRSLVGARTGALLVAGMVLVAVGAGAPAAQAATSVFVNELHYDNAETDSGEAIEVAAPMGTDLTGWSIHLYNGDNPASGVTYGSPQSLTGAIGETRTTVITLPTNGLQNGPSDGLALVNPSNQVIQLLSYEGTFTATNGPAAGMSSVNIGVSESSSTPVGHSLQLTGSGDEEADFTWTGPKAASFGALNAGQTFDGASGGGEEPPELGACGDEATAIPDIQGGGAATPLAGEVVVAEGVVVGDYQGATGTGDLDGFYLQAPVGDADPATSDGVFVHDPDAPEVSSGDVVRVRGTAGEAFGQTQVGSVDARTVCSTGGSLPAATALALPDDAEILERLEGMLVEIPGEMTVNESRNLDDFGEVRISAGGLLHTPTEVAEPGPEAVAVAEENERRTIILDDGLDGSFHTPVPFLAPDQTLRRGDSVTGLDAVLGFGFSAYRLRPVGPISFAEHNPRPESPGEVGGDLQVASFNVLNYFTTLGSRGAQTAEEFERQEAKIVAAINGLGADVVALEEIESNDGLALDTLVDAMNEDAEDEVWAAVPEPANFSGTDLITVALIYRVDAVAPVGDSIAFPDPAFAIARQPIAQTFEASGETFTVIANHFKSKSCSGATGGDADQGDGQGCFNPTRVAQAEALLSFIDQLETSTGDSDLIAFGDFNAYSKEDPVDTLEAGGLSDLGEQVPEAQRYTFVFDGYQGSLDHAFATASLTEKVTGVAPWHINADEPDAFEYGGATELYGADPYRSSDHDPELIGIASSAPEGPVNTQPPSVAGKPRVGHKLRCDRGEWTGAEEFEFGWLRDGQLIEGADERKYELVRADRGHMIACRVIALGPELAGDRPRTVADSEAVGPVNAK